MVKIKYCWTWSLSECKKRKEELKSKKPYIGFWSDLYDIEGNEYFLKKIFLKPL
jgi:hypothetical protein